MVDHAGTPQMASQRPAREAAPPPSRFHGAYRMLRGMEGAGLIESWWDTEVSSGPARRIYQLTPRGDAALADWVSQLSETDQVLHRFLDRYDKHMREGEGEFH